MINSSQNTLLATSPHQGEKNQAFTRRVKSGALELALATKEKAPFNRAMKAWSERLQTRGAVSIPGNLDWSTGVQPPLKSPLLSLSPREAPFSFRFCATLLCASSPRCRRPLGAYSPFHDDGGGVRLCSEIIMHTADAA